MIDSLFVILALFFASLTQGLTGFGLALVAMPFLVRLLGVQTAAPLLALVSILIQVPVLIRYRKDLRLRAVARLGITVIIGVPLGVVALRQLDPTIVTRILGVVVVGYGVYALITPHLPEIKHPAWAYPFGLASGLLSGAYSTGGPPLIIYGDFCRWSPGEFKGNLQSVFMLTTVMQLISHGAAGNLTPVVWHNALIGLPGVVLGVAAGLSLDRFINPDLFHKIVLVLIVVLGIGLFF